MGSAYSSAYLSLTVFAKETGINRDKLKLYLNNHHKHIIYKKMGNRYLIHKSEIGKIKHIHALYRKGLSAEQVASVLENPAELDKYVQKTEKPNLSGLSRKQLINAFYNEEYPEGSCFYCIATGRTAIFRKDRIESIEGYALTVSRTAEQWVHVEFEPTEEKGKYRIIFK
jgi:hypothetical protein